MRVAEIEFGGELHAVLDAQVLLPLEALLESVQLVISERRPRLARLLGLAAGSATAARAGAAMMLQRLP